MDLFTIAGTLWRHKLVTIPVILLTMMGTFYILVIKPATYEATASVLLTNPPAPPTAAQIVADPSLARVNTYNPLASLGNPVLIADVLIQVVTSPTTKNALAREGADPGYQVALDVSLETPPAIDITGVGANAQSATQSAQLVADAVSQDLLKMQVSQHVNSNYMMSSVEYVYPTSTTSTTSGKLRSAIAVVAVGFIFLLLVVSVSQSIEQRKKRNLDRGKTASHAVANHESQNGPAAQVRERPRSAAEDMGRSQSVSSVYRNETGTSEW